jgi:hypothetical protein
MVLVLSGCRHDSPPASTPQAAGEARIEQIRRTLTEQDPGVVVGQVIETLPEARLVAVGPVPVDQFRKGDIITFIDQDINVIGTGKVYRIISDQVHVRVDEALAGQRAPHVGDLGVLAVKH